MVRVKRIGSVINEFGLWIPAFAGMTVMVRLPWRSAPSGSHAIGSVVQLDRPSATSLLDCSRETIP